MAMPSSLFLFALGVSIAVWVTNWVRRRDKLPEGIPLVRFEDGEDSYQRYLKDSRTVVKQGYNKYIKNGKPFSMYNSANPNRPLVFLPLKYLDELKSAHRNTLSLRKALDQRAGLDKIGGFLLTDEVVSVVKLAMTRALGQLTPEVNDNCAAAFQEFMPACPRPNWTEVNLMQLILRVWTRMISRVIVGAELSRSSAWLGEMNLFIPTCIKAVFALRTGYTKSTYWMAKYTNREIKELYRLRSRIAKLLEPLVTERVAAAAAARTPGTTTTKRRDLHADAVQWFVDEYEKKRVKPTADQIAGDVLTLSLVSLASTTATTVGVIYDLLDHPKSLKEIKEEMARVRKETGDTVTRQALGQMVILDGFAKESQRTNPINQISMHRLALQDYTFKDGLHIPAGTDVAFTNELLSKDPDVWAPNATEFDPHRFSHAGAATEKQQPMTAITEDMLLPWGAGPHACPGRFLAADGIKMMVMNLVYRYEFKYPEGVSKRPENDKGHLTMGPCSSLGLLFREKDVPGFD